MSVSDFQQIRDRLRQLYLEDPRPWLVGFSGGKDSMLVSALVFETVLSVPTEQRTKPVSILCTDTRVEIPAISEGVETVLDRMRRFSQQEGLNIEAHLLKPPPEQSFWVNIIGRGCKERMEGAPRRPASTASSSVAEKSSSRSSGVGRFPVCQTSTNRQELGDN